MRMAVKAHANRARLALRAILTGALAAMVLADAVASRSYSDEPSPRDWLKCNENGEPYEVALADGSLLKLPTYGDEYEAFRTAPPVNGVKAARAVVDYQRDRLGSGWGANALALDVAGRKIYWLEIGYSKKANLVCAGLNGENPRRLLDLYFQQPTGLAVDHELRKLYWSTSAGGQRGAFGQGPEARHAVWQANLNGSRPEPLFTALTMPLGIAVDGATKSIFYFDDLRLMRGDADGRNEAVVIDRLVLPENRGYRGWSAKIDQKHRKIYWSGGNGPIARANLDGSEFEAVYSVYEPWEHSGLALDLPNEKIYWGAVRNGEVWRANLDGTQAELIAMGMLQSGQVDVDSQHGFVYWRDQKRIGSEGFSVIRRLKLPPLPVAETKPAPPQITSITPPRQRALGKVVVHGKHFTGVEKVRLIGDDGRQANAGFEVVSDRELAIAVPAKREGVKRAAIVVQGPGGVTVTIPRDAEVVKRDKMGKPATSYDRTKDGEKFCFVVRRGEWFRAAEHALVYVEEGAWSTPNGGRGQTVMFVKDGSLCGAGRNASNIVFYHEPFARIIGRAKAEGDHEYIPVPAIRPSFVEALLEYEQPE